MTRNRTAAKLMVLDQVSPDFALGGSGSGMLPVGYDSSSSSDVRKIRKEFERQHAALVALEKKQLAVQRAIKNTSQAGMNHFAQTAEYGTLVSHEAEGEDHAPRVEQFNDAMVESAAQSMLGTQKLTATGLATILSQSPYPVESEEKPGFLRRLFGG